MGALLTRNNSLGAQPRRLPSGKIANWDPSFYPTWVACAWQLLTEMSHYNVTLQIVLIRWRILNYWSLGHRCIRREKMFFFFLRSRLVRLCLVCVYILARLNVCRISYKQFIFVMFLCTCTQLSMKYLKLMKTFKRDDSRAWSGVMRSVFCLGFLSGLMDISSRWESKIMASSERVSHIQSKDICVFCLCNCIV